MPKWRNFTRKKKPLMWPKYGEIGYTCRSNPDTDVYVIMHRRRNDNDSVRLLSSDPHANVIEEVIVNRDDVARLLRNFAIDRQGLWIYQDRPFTDADLPVLYEE